MTDKNSQSKPLKTRMIFGVLWLFAKSPLWLTQPFMSLCARISKIINSRSYQTTITNLQICYPDLSEKERDNLALNSLKHTFKIAPEIAKAWLQPCIEDWIDKVHGAEQIKADLANGVPILITGSHIGNWEVALFYLGKAFDFTCMYRQPRYKELDDIICNGRCKNTTKMVPGDGKGLRQFIGALKKCQVAALLSDQEPGGDTGVFAPFFNQQAKTMDLIQKIQCKTNANVYQVAAIKNSKGKYDIHLPKVDVDTALDAKEYASELNKNLEMLIRQYPEQYQWSYKRFKTTPDGSKNPYLK